MYLYLGDSKAVLLSAVVGIFDSKTMRESAAHGEALNHDIITAVEIGAPSFILLRNGEFLASFRGVRTLAKRAISQIGKQKGE